MRYKHGDTRADGFRFMQYQKLDGREQEAWLSPKSFDRYCAHIRNKNKRHVIRVKVDPLYKTKALAATVKWYRADWRRSMFHAAKQRAKNKGILFNLKSIEDIPKSLKCPVFNLPFSFNTNGKADWLSPSLDRIIPKKGYTKGNVIVVCRLANSIKSNAHPDQILAVAKFYKKLFKKLKLP